MLFTSAWARVSKQKTVHVTHSTMFALEKHPKKGQKDFTLTLPQPARFRSTIVINRAEPWVWHTGSVL